jgi:hypothetical protein
MGATGVAKRTSTPSGRIKPLRVPCPHCKEIIPETSRRCIFCDRAVDFEEREKKRRERTRQTIRSVRARHQEKSRSGGLLTGILVLLVALLILGSSLLGLIYVPEQVTIDIGGTGLVMGAAGVLFAIHLIKQSFRPH